VRRAVKSQRFRNVARRLGVCLAAAGLVVGSDLATTEAQILRGITGPPIRRKPAPLSVALPLGAQTEFPPRPPGADAPAACSFRFPLCVHAAKTVSDTEVMTALGALERAYERLVGVLHAPAPLPDDARGGGPSLDLYLLRDASPLRVEADAPDVVVSHDAASAYCVLGASDPAIDRDATLCLGEAIAWGIDASETPFSRRALATYWWLVVGSPTSADVAAYDDYQSAPERSTVAREPSRYAEGSAAFLDYLDRDKGRGDPGALPLATFVLSGRARSPLAERWVNEPDTLDVLRTTFGATSTDFARELCRFAVARAFMGTRDAGGAFPDLAFTGDFGRVRFEWSVPFSSLPRNLAPSRAVFPLGATYLWVSMDSPPAKSTLTLSFDWEPPVAFAWSVVLVGPDGRALRTVDVPFLERGTHVERTVEDLSGAAGVLIVGTNLGGLGPSYPFDPDFEPFEPHAYSVYVAKQ